MLNSHLQLNVDCLSRAGDETENLPRAAELALFETELRPGIPEHRALAARFRFCDGALSDVPMFHKDSVLHSHDVHNNER